MITRTLMNSVGEFELERFSLYVHHICLFSWLKAPVFCISEVHYVQKRYWPSSTHGCCSGRVPPASQRVSEVTSIISYIFLLLYDWGWLRSFYVLCSLTGPAWEHVSLPGYDHAEGPKDDCCWPTRGADPAWGSYQPADLHHGGKPDISYVRKTREVRWWCFAFWFIPASLPCLTFDFQIKAQNKASQQMISDENVCCRLRSGRRGTRRRYWGSSRTKLTKHPSVQTRLKIRKNAKNKSRNAKRRRRLARASSQRSGDKE